MLVHAGHFKAERRRKIFFVAEHHIDKWRDAAIHFLRLLLSAERFPERRAIIQIVGNDRAVLPRSLHRFQRNVRRRRRQRAENSAGVQPARAVLSKNFIPVEIAGLQMRNRRVSAIVRARRRAYAESALRKIQSVARRSADAIVRHPAHVRLIDATLIQQVLQQACPTGSSANAVTIARIEAEAALQPARDVVFAAALANLEAARGRNAPVARIEPHHHFAKTHEVPAAILLCSNFQWQRDSLTNSKSNCAWHAPAFSDPRCVSAPALSLFAADFAHSETPRFQGIKSFCAKLLRLHLRLPLAT